MRLQRNTAIILVVFSLPIILITYFIFRDNQSPSVTTDAEGLDSKNVAVQVAKNWNYMKIVSGIAKRKVIIFTTLHAGSSFFGEIFKQNPAAHYLSEPFKLIYVDETAEREVQIAEYNEQLSNWCETVLNCNYTDLFEKSYENKPFGNAAARRQATKEVFGKFVNASDVDKVNIMDLNVTGLEDTCKAYDVHLIKVIRGTNYNSLKSLLMKDIRTLFLIRDIRAMMISRFEILAREYDVPFHKFISKPENKELFIAGTRRECERHLKILEFMKMLIPMERVYRRKLRVVRFEDFAKEPMRMTERIYKFLELPVPPETRDRIFNITTPEDKQSGRIISHSGTKGPKSGIEGWRDKIPFDVLLKVNQISSCVRVFDFFGYSHITDKKNLQNKDVSFVKKHSLMLRFMI